MEEVNPVLTGYFEYSDINDKIDYILRKRADITGRIIYDIAICEDIALPDEGDDITLFDSLLSAMKTKAKYEKKRY